MKNSSAGISTTLNAMPPRIKTKKCRLTLAILLQALKDSQTQHNTTQHNPIQNQQPFKTRKYNMSSLSRSNSSSSLSSQFSQRPEKRLKTGDRSQSSPPVKANNLFDLSEMQKKTHPNSLDVFKLSNQKNFIELRKEIINNVPHILSTYGNDSGSYFINLEEISQCKKYIDVIEQNLQQKYKLSSSAMGLKIGIDGSDTLHIDNASIFSDEEEEYNYTIIIPLLDYDTSGQGDHNFQPYSTIILPQNVKQNSNLIDRSTASKRKDWYLDAEKEEKLVSDLVSHPLKQGTAIIVHTATEVDSEDDGKSVIHASPETPIGYQRIFLITTGNKINPDLDILHQKPAAK